MVDVTEDLTLKGDFAIGNLVATTIEAQSIKINGQDISEGAKGEKGDKGDPGKDGADGKDGVTPVIEIRDDYWYINNVNTGIKAKGEDGEDASLNEDIATKTWVEEFVAGKILATPW